MIVRVKDFASSCTQIKDFAALFGDAKGEDCLTPAWSGDKGIDAEHKRLDFVASDDSVDLDDEIMAGGGHDLRSSYMANPVILAEHQHRLPSGESPVMAYARELHTEKSPLVGVAQFGGNRVSADHWAAYRDGLQRAFSVGFRTRDTERREGRLVHTRAAYVPYSPGPRRGHQRIYGRRHQRLRGHHGSVRQRQRGDGDDGRRGHRFRGRDPR